ncbi:hypothetical protein [Hoeflea sp.]|uniref:hypothetical protein n=1 Tax=Hoeflea sp. TaxID=1940281 RepID=UPI00374A97C3
MDNATIPPQSAATTYFGGRHMIGPRLPLPADPAALAARPAGFVSKEAPAVQPNFGSVAPAPVSLELMELELALDLDEITERGFCEAVRDAAKASGAEFLFDLPASGLIEEAQRIAVICLSRKNGGRFGLVLLSPEGDRAIALEPGQETAGLVQFAKAFVAVLERL